MSTRKLTWVVTSLIMAALALNLALAQLGPLLESISDSDGWLPSSTSQPNQSHDNNPDTLEGASSTNSAASTKLLDQVTVIPTRPNVPGYDRAAFGPSWKDVDRNGCDTRNDVLGDQLTDVVHKVGTHDCIVLEGRLADPYTGKSIHFSKSNANAVHVDHVYALSMAWDMGASTWTQARREQFANDRKLNLLAVDGPTNMSKSDQGPDTWSPANTAGACQYATAYLKVAVNYQLPITRAEHTSLSTTIKHAC